MNPGPQPNLKLDKKIAKYRLKTPPLTFLEIARLLSKKGKKIWPSDVYRRWLRYKKANGISGK